METIENDLGNINNVNEWVEEISKEYEKVFRALQQGRKIFIKVMNLFVRLENGVSGH